MVHLSIRQLLLQLVSASISSLLIILFSTAINHLILFLQDPDVDWSSPARSLRYRSFHRYELFLHNCKCFLHLLFFESFFPSVWYEEATALADNTGSSWLPEYSLYHVPVQSYLPDTDSEPVSHTIHMAITLRLRDQLDLPFGQGPLRLFHHLCQFFFLSCLYRHNCQMRWNVIVRHKSISVFCAILLIWSEIILLLLSSKYTDTDTFYLSPLISKLFFHNIVYNVYFKM